MRELKGAVAKAVTIIALAMAVFHLYTAAFGTMVALLQRALHLVFAITLVFLLHPAKKKSDTGKISIWDFILAITAVVSFGHVALTYEAIRVRMPLITPMNGMDIVFGAIAIFLIIEAARRVLGWSMAVIPLIALVYALIGPYCPGVLWHRGFTPLQVIDYLYLGYDGIFGIPVGISSTYMVIFIIFGCIMEKSGTGNLIMDLSCLFAGRSQGGPAKVAVVSSALFGMVSGAAVSNVYTTGTFTIPLMKKLGYRSEFAGAVESVASTGGQLMPPVLGAAAFVMADWLGVPYIQICIAAIIPAFLYFLAVILMVHLEAVKTGLAGLEEDKIPDRKKVIKNLYLLVPLAGLITMLLLGYTVFRSAFVATVVAFAVSFFGKDSRMDLNKTLNALELGAKRATMIAVATACAGIIIGVITLTGIGLNITSAIVVYFKDYLFLALFFTMVASLIMGMGVPTVVAYIIVATLASPILTKLGVPPLAAHMFVFYYGIIAMITPPVAVAAWAGAEIAEANYTQTAFTAVKLGIVAFIIPYMFIYGPALLSQGKITGIIYAGISASIGVICLASGLGGWLLARITAWPRFLLFIAGISLIHSNPLSDAFGFLLFGIVLLVQKIGLQANGVRHK